MVLSHLNYGILVWGFDLDRLFKLQKKAIRIITGSKYNAHTEPLFKSLKTLKLTDIFRLNILKFYFKYKSSALPKFLLTINFETRSNVHGYNTRNKDTLDQQRTKTKTASQCI